MGAVLWRKNEPCGAFLNASGSLQFPPKQGCCPQSLHRCEMAAGGFEPRLNTVSTFRKVLAPCGVGGEQDGWDVFSGMWRGGS